MKYKDLRDFIRQLESKGELVRISQPIDTDLEMTEIADRTLRAGGPAGTDTQLRQVSKFEDVRVTSKYATTRARIQGSPTGMHGVRRFRLVEGPGL